MSKFFEKNKSDLPYQYQQNKDDGNTDFSQMVFENNNEDEEEQAQELDDKQLKDTKK